MNQIGSFQLMEAFPGLCWGHCFSQSSSIMYFHWATTPQLKSSVCTTSRNVVTTYCRDVSTWKCSVPQRYMAHLGVWSHGAEGGWDSRGAVAIPALLSQTSQAPFWPGRAQRSTAPQQLSWLLMPSSACIMSASPGRVGVWACDSAL